MTERKLDPATSFLALCDYLLQDENGISWEAFDFLWAVGTAFGFDMEIVKNACDSSEGQVYYESYDMQFTGKEVRRGA